MFEAPRSQMPALARPRFIDPLPDLLAADVPLEVYDNEIVVAPREGERRTFELPASVWKVMVASYGIFLAALLGATGGGHAGFAIAISAIYVMMFFGTAHVILRQAPPQPRSALDRSGAVLQTIYGPLERREVYGQVLIVPVAIAFFGVAIAVIRAWVA